MSIALSVRLPERLAKELTHVALLAERPKSFLVQKALES
jgi:RHH-type rel operon transcriptional repressor/antitoxin RelB